jgi:hypothetical protein
MFTANYLKIMLIRSGDSYLKKVRSCPVDYHNNNGL